MDKKDDHYIPITDEELDECFGVDWKKDSFTLPITDEDLDEFLRVITEEPIKKNNIVPFRPSRHR